MTYRDAIDHRGDLRLDEQSREPWTFAHRFTVWFCWCLLIPVLLLLLTGRI